MTDKKDPLAALLMDADEVDRARLAGALGELLGVDTKTGRVVLKPGFDALPARQKMIAYLLGKKISRILAKTDTEAAGVTEIKKDTGLPLGTVAPNLRRLKEDGILSQTSSKQYYVENHALNYALEELEGG
jgi:hypothetical protein